jgi:hypothetical protein
VAATKVELFDRIRHESWREGLSVRAGKGGYRFGDAAILTGNTWISEPAIKVTGGFGPVVRIPGTESFPEPASVENFGFSVQKPTIYRFDL